MCGPETKEASRGEYDQYDLLNGEVAMRRRRVVKRVNQESEIYEIGYQVEKMDNSSETCSAFNGQMSPEMISTWE